MCCTTRTYKVIHVRPADKQTNKLNKANKTNNFLQKIIKIYENPLSEKLQIFQDNKGKALVYRWVNKLNNKSYVGSTVNSYFRFYRYFNVNNLKNVNINISSMSSKKENNVVQIKISDTAFLNEIIIPFFKDLQFITKKGKDFKD